MEKGEPEKVEARQMSASQNPTSPSSKWQRNASKDGWFKLGPDGLVDVSDLELREFEKARHADLRGVNAQGRLDLLLAART
jgi:hypothetical protein